MNKDHVLQDIDHLLDNTFKEIDQDASFLRNEEFVGLVDPGPLSPGSLDFLENYQYDIEEKIDQRQLINQGSLQKNINNKHHRFINGTDVRFYTRRSHQSQIESSSDFPYCNINLDHNIYNIEDGEYPSWNSPNTQSLVEGYNHKDKISLYVQKSLHNIDVPHRKRSNINQKANSDWSSNDSKLRGNVVKEIKRVRSLRSNTLLNEDWSLNSRKRFKSGEMSSYSPTLQPLKEYQPPTAKDVIYTVLGKKQAHPVEKKPNDITLDEQMCCLDNDDEVIQSVKYDNMLNNHHEEHESPKQPNSPNDNFTKELENYIDKTEKLQISHKALSKINELDALNTSEFDIDTSNFDFFGSSSFNIFENVDEVGENLCDSRIVAYVSSTSQLVNMYDSNLNNNTNETNLKQLIEFPEILPKSKEPSSLYNNDNDAYVLNENQCANLYVLPPEENQPFESETTNASLQQIPPFSNTIESNSKQVEKSLLKLKSLKEVHETMDVENAWKPKIQQDLNANIESINFQKIPKLLEKTHELTTCCSTIHEIGSSSTHIEDDRWQTTPYSENFNIALPYIDKPIPLEWKSMNHPRLIGVCMTIFSKSQMLEAWNIINNNHDIDDSKKSIWNPQTYLDDVSKSYNRYFPIVMEKSTLKVLAFDYRNNDDIDEVDKDFQNKGWTIMPSLNWIKSRIIARVIAANDGLLVLDSVKPSIATIYINYKLVLHENKKHSKDVYEKNQSLLTIINPLTHEYLFLPPVPFNQYREKIGCLSFFNAKERHYQLFILGSSTIEPTLEDINEHKKMYGINAPRKRSIPIVYLAIYSSLDKQWVHFDSFEYTIINNPWLGGRGSCIIINYGLYFGGIKLTPSPEKDMDFEIPSIFYINYSTTRLQYIIHPFLLHGIGNIRIPEPPKIIKVANNKIYAVTREASKTTMNRINQVVIVEVLLNKDGSPNGQYALVENGIMPKIYVNKLFQKISSEKRPTTYEVYSSTDLIAFRISYPLFVLYDVHKTKWRLTYYERDIKVGQNKNYIMFEGVYQPDWLAIV